MIVANGYIHNEAIGFGHLLKKTGVKFPPICFTTAKHEVLHMYITFQA